MGKAKSNYEIAKIEADKTDKKIIETLCSEKSFRVEAGAGSGKTYSLNKNPRRRAAGYLGFLFEIQLNNVS